MLGVGIVDVAMPVAIRPAVGVDDPDPEHAVGDRVERGAASS